MSDDLEAKFDRVAATAIEWKRRAEAAEAALSRITKAADAIVRDVADILALVNGESPHLLEDNIAFAHLTVAALPDWNAAKLPTGDAGERPKCENCYRFTEEAKPTCEVCQGSGKKERRKPDAPRDRRVSDKGHWNRRDYTKGDTLRWFQQYPDRRRSTDRSEG